ncbi:MAG: hypothetical protein ACLPWS_15525 [Rhodomicrobium sp.]
MTKLLEEAIAMLKTLGDEQQERVAGLLLHLAEGEPEFELTQEQIEGIELSKGVSARPISPIGPNRH